MLWAAGVDLPTIAAILGHSNIEVTIKYLGIRMDDMESAMARMPF